jgi:hypothetical protein
MLLHCTVPVPGKTQWGARDTHPVQYRYKDTGGSRDTRTGHTDGTRGRTKRHTDHTDDSTGKKTPGGAGTHTGHLGCIRVSNGCHRKFRGHNFDSCVTNFDKISVFLFAPAMANFVDFTATSEFVTAVYRGEQCAKPHTRTHDSVRRLTRRAARSAAGLWGAGAEDGETV